VSEPLKVLDQQPLGSFDGNGHGLAEPAQLSVQCCQPDDVVGNPQLGQPLAGVVDYA
jgi:hypothetical protein